MNRLSDIQQKFGTSILESFTKKTSSKKKEEIVKNSEEPVDIFKTVAEYIIANSFENTYDDEWKEGDFDCYVKDWENCDIIRKNLRFEFMDEIGQVSLDGIGPYKLRLLVSDGEYKSISCFFSPLESDARKKRIDTDRLGENNDTDFMEDLTNEERLKIAKFLGCFSEVHESFTKRPQGRNHRHSRMKRTTKCSKSMISTRWENILKNSLRKRVRQKN